MINLTNNQVIAFNNLMFYLKDLKGKYKNTQYLSEIKTLYIGIYIFINKIYKREYKIYKNRIICIVEKNNKIIKRYQYKLKKR